MIADIVLPLALDAPYSYRVPEGMALQPGQTVHVPLGTRETFGLVWSVDEKASGENLKAIRAVSALPPLPDKLMTFLQRVAAYTLAPLGLVARMAMRDPEAEAHEAPKFGLRVTGTAPRRLTPTRARVMAVAVGGLTHRKRDLADAAGCSTGVIDALVDEGVFEIVPLPSLARAAPLDLASRGPVLNDQQREAADMLSGLVKAGGFAPVLLEGVTGSGKTEVYFEAVAAALQAGRQALILLPEISLTPEFVARFEARFGGAPGLWHSGIAATRRDRLWHAVAEGEAKVVVGARSALFLPFSALG
nr:DEAD/DEAH box helicase [Beijerinckiaceae bacterium]